VRVSTTVPRSDPLRFKHCCFCVLLSCGSSGSSGVDDVDRLGSIRCVLFPLSPVVVCARRFFPFLPVCACSWGTSCVLVSSSLSACILCTGRTIIYDDSICGKPASWQPAGSPSETGNRRAIFMSTLNRKKESRGRYRPRDLSVSSGLLESSQY
jgi:hypothetical protein